jgi:hypothetical protein
MDEQFADVGRGVRHRPDRRPLTTSPPPGWCPDGGDGWNRYGAGVLPVSFPAGAGSVDGLGLLDDPLSPPVLGGGLSPDVEAGAGSAGGVVAGVLVAGGSDLAPEPVSPLSPGSVFDPGSGVLLGLGSLDGGVDDELLDEPLDEELLLDAGAGLDLALTIVTLRNVVLPATSV